MKATSLQESQIEIISKKDNKWKQQLEVADSIAWSAYQKYPKGEPKFLDIVKEKIKSILELGVDGSGMMRPISEMSNE